MFLSISDWRDINGFHVTEFTGGPDEIGLVCITYLHHPGHAFLLTAYSLCMHPSVHQHFLANLPPVKVFHDWFVNCGGQALAGGEYGEDVTWCQVTWE